MNKPGQESDKVLISKTILKDLYDSASRMEVFFNEQQSMVHVIKKQCENIFEKKEIANAD
jgi:hypothetical protein